MSSGRKLRSAAKALDAVKVVLAILGLLLGCILVLWVATRLMQPKEMQPDYAPRPGKSMWEEPVPAP